MAKIRTIKPELFRHAELFEAEQEIELPLRLAFMGLFTCCDREGRFKWRPKELKLDVFPYDDIDMANVLDALVSYGFIVKYQVDHCLYGCIPSWHNHQRINNRETESYIPPVNPENIILPTDVFSTNSIEIQSCLTDESSVPHASAQNLSMLQGNGIGRELEMEGEVEKEMEQGKEGKEHIVASPRRRSVSPPDVLKIFEYWKNILNHPQAVLDKSREKMIHHALQRGFSVQQLCNAIQGCAKTPHNMGDNERGQRYDGLHVIFRDADQIERFIYNCSHPPQAVRKTEKLLQANITAGQNWLKKQLAEGETD